MTIQRVEYKIQHPDGFCPREFGPSFCPGCGITHGYAPSEFIRHMKHCTGLRDRTVLVDDYDQMKVAEPNP